MRKILFTSGIVLALIGYAFFSISDACSKGLAGRLDPFEVAFFGGRIRVADRATIEAAK